jgi:putative oxidoreductase
MTEIAEISDFHHTFNILTQTFVNFDGDLKRKDMKSSLFRSTAISLDLGLLLLRLVAGSAMLTHGWPKLEKALAGSTQFADPIGVGPELTLYLAILAEFLCSLLVMLGFATRVAVIPLIATMLVAFFIVHSADPFAIKESSFIFTGIFASLFFTGPGKYSLDYSIK